MKTNKVLMISLVLIAIVFAACSPAQVASGNYNITAFSTTHLPTTSGTSGTVKITENGADKVNIVVNTSGNPDFNVSGVSVTKISVPGINEVTFSASGNYDVTGTFAQVSGINTLALDITNNIDTTYISLSASK